MTQTIEDIIYGSVVLVYYAFIIIGIIMIAATFFLNVYNVFTDFNIPSMLTVISICIIMYILGK